MRDLREEKYQWEDAEQAKLCAGGDLHIAALGYQLFEKNTAFRFRL